MCAPPAFARSLSTALRDGWPCRYFVPAPGFLCDPSKQDCSRFEDSYDALVNIQNSWIVTLALLGNICSIAFFK